MRRIILSVLGMLSLQIAMADEGMWMINAINAALEKKMQERGLELPASALYDADAPGSSISDAIVSLDFGCSGSIISDNGLLITNHHCAYSDVHALSTPEHNYLEEGFWAMTSAEEIPIKGKKVQFLHKVIDVTDEVRQMMEEQTKLGKSAGMRRISYLMETKYQKETGYMASLGSMWSGSKYYMSLYKEYRDVRLVAAPPVSMAAFGGDIDNWEWPQHKCDFAMYRIYTAPDGSPADYSEGNVPMKPKAKLSVSTKGYKPGDYTMIIGYPGSTDRYSSSAEVDFKQNLSLPITNRLRGQQMVIIKDWMDADENVRLAYADNFFSLSNVQELQSGEVICFKRFGVIDKKKDIEKELQEWISADPVRNEKWGNLISELNRKYEAVKDAEKDITYYRETIVRGTRMGRMLGKITALKNEVMRCRGIRQNRGVGSKPSEEEKECCRSYRFKAHKFQKICDNLTKEFEELDLRVEKDLFFFSVKEFYENVNPICWTETQKELYNRFSHAAACDYEALASYIWDNSFLTDKTRMYEFINSDRTLDEYYSDTLFDFLKSGGIINYNQRIQKIEGTPDISALSKAYTQALYQMRMEKGVPQYPDANSTMRITYGTVGGIEPYDGVICSWRTTAAGILEKHNPDDYDFTLNERQIDLYTKAEWGKWSTPEGDMYIDFLTDNDITGGNSGSPVMNSKGELIGLAFDGNKESLASDAWYTPDYNKCVCVDIRFILWTLEHYAGMDYIIKEIGL